MKLIFQSEPYTNIIIITIIIILLLFCCFSNEFFAENFNKKQEKQFHGQYSGLTMDSPQSILTSSLIFSATIILGEWVFPHGISGKLKRDSLRLLTCCSLSKYVLTSMHRRLSKI